MRPAGGGSLVEEPNGDRNRGPRDKCLLRTTSLDDMGWRDLARGPLFAVAWLALVPVDGTFDTSSIIFQDLDGTHTAPFCADFDGDGDKDCIVGSSSTTVSYFENLGTSTSPSFTSTTPTSADFFLLSTGAYKNSYNAPWCGDFDDDGDLDCLVGSKKGRVAYMENVGSSTSASWSLATGDYFDQDVGSFASVACADLDYDGDLDCLVGSKSGDIYYVENTGSVSVASWSDTGKNTLIDIASSSPYECSYAALTCQDFDGDKDIDCVIGCGAGIILLFENTGSKRIPLYAWDSRFSDSFLESPGSRVTPSCTDMNSDGYSDCLVGFAASEVYFAYAWSCQGAGYQGSNCSICSPGYYQAANSSACTGCPKGKSTLGISGATTCSTCDTGYFSEATGTTECNACSCHKPGTSKEVCSSTSGECDCLDEFQEDDCSYEQKILVSYSLGIFALISMVVIVSLVFHPKVLLISSLAGVIRGHVFETILKMRKLATQAALRAAEKAEKKRLKEESLNSTRTKQQKHRLTLLRSLLVFIAVAAAAICMFLASFLKFVVNVYLIVKGSVTVDADAYEARMEVISSSLHQYLRANMPSLTFLGGAYDWVYGTLLKIIDSIDFGIAGDVTCLGSQAAVFLAIDYIIFLAITTLFDSTLYVFLAVAVDDYLYDPDSNGKSKFIKNKHVELLTKSLLYGVERAFKNVIQLMCSHLVFKKFIPAWSSVTFICNQADGWTDMDKIMAIVSSTAFWIFVPLFLHLLLHSFIYGLPKWLNNHDEQLLRRSISTYDDGNLYLEFIERRQQSISSLEEIYEDNESSTLLNILHSDNLDSFFHGGGGDDEEEEGLDARVESFRHKILSTCVDGKQLLSLDKQTLEHAGMAKKEAERFAKSLRSKLCLRCCGDEHRGDILLNHSTRFWQNIPAVARYFWHLGNNGEVKGSARFFKALRLYLATMSWKFFLLMKLSVGFWDSELLDMMEIKHRCAQFDINMEDTDMKHEAMIKAVGESHSLAWQLIPYCTIVSKGAEAFNASPIFTEDGVVSEVMRDKLNYQGPFGRARRVLDVELEPSAEVEMSAEPLEVAQVDEGVELVAAGDQFSLFGIFSNGETERRTGEGEEGVLLENVNLDETEKKITLDLNQPLTFRAMDTTDGCVLSIVEKGSEMDLAGISAGSRIMSCGGNKVESVTEIKNILLDCISNEEGSCDITISEGKIEPLSKLPELKGEEEGRTYSIIKIELEPAEDFWTTDTKARHRKQTRDLFEKPDDEVRFSRLEDDDEGRGILVWFNKHTKSSKSKKRKKKRKKLASVGYRNLPSFCRSPLCWITCKTRRILGFDHTENYVSFYSSLTDRRITEQMEAFEAVFWGQTKKVRGVWGQGGLPTRSSPLFIKSPSLSCEVLYYHPNDLDPDWSISCAYVEASPVVMKSSFKMRCVYWLLYVLCFAATAAVCFTTVNNGLYFGLFIYAAGILSSLDAIKWTLTNKSIPKPNADDLKSFAASCGAAARSILQCGKEVKVPQAPPSGAVERGAQSIGGKVIGVAEGMEGTMEDVEEGGDVVVVGEAASRAAEAVLSSVAAEEASV